MPGCAIASCKNNYQKTMHQDIRYHRFPKDKAMIKEWLQKCKRDDINVAAARVCSQHFTEDDYKIALERDSFGMPMKKYLKPIAVPKVSLPTLNHNTIDAPHNEKEKNKKASILKKAIKNDVTNMCMETIKHFSIKKLTKEQETATCKSCIQLLKLSKQLLAENALLKEELKKLKQQSVCMNQTLKRKTPKTRRLMVKFMPKIKKERK